MPLFLLVFIFFVIVVVIVVFFVPEFAFFFGRVLLFVKINALIKILLLGIVLFFIDKFEFILQAFSLIKKRVIVSL